MFLIDTNVLSELRKGSRVDLNVSNWFRAQDKLKLYLSVVTILEIEIGARRMLRRDPCQGQAFRDWIDRNVVPTFDSRILDINRAIMIRCAELHVPDPKPDHDALIAATAHVYRLTLVTRNVRDFSKMGVAVVNPFEA